MLLARDAAQTEPQSSRSLGKTTKENNTQYSRCLVRDVTGHWGSLEQGHMQQPMVAKKGSLEEGHEAGLEGHVE